MSVWLCNYLVERSTCHQKLHLHSLKYVSDVATISYSKISKGVRSLLQPTALPSLSLGEPFFLQQTISPSSVSARFIVHINSFSELKTLSMSKNVSSQTRILKCLLLGKGGLSLRRQVDLLKKVDLFFTKQCYMMSNVISYYSGFYMTTS